MVNWLGQMIQNYISPDDSVLDLGCGIMQATDDLKVKSILGCDVFPPYLEHIKHIWPTIRIGMDETWRFMDESYDVVICLDVVEHLPKELALQVIKECKRICRKSAIIYTPNEFKDNKHAIDDSWGLGENILHEHICLIEKVDFHSNGYHVDNPAGDGLLATFDR